MSSVNGKHIVAYAILSIKKNYTLSTHVVHSFKANKSLNYAIITHQYSFTASCVWLFFRSISSSSSFRALVTQSCFSCCFCFTIDPSYGFGGFAHTLHINTHTIVFDACQFHVSTVAISPFHSRQKVTTKEQQKTNNIFASVRSRAHHWHGRCAFLSVRFMCQ